MMTLNPSDVVAGSGLSETTGAEGKPLTVKLIWSESVNPSVSVAVRTKL